MRKEDIEKLWNDQADEYNQWSELDSDEKVEWTIQCFEKDIIAEFEEAIDDGDFQYLLAEFENKCESLQNGKYKIIIKEVE